MGAALSLELVIVPYQRASHAVYRRLESRATTEGLGALQAKAINQSMPARFSNWPHNGIPSRGHSSLGRVTPRSESRRLIYRAVAMGLRDEYPRNRADEVCGPVIHQQNAHVVEDPDKFANMYYSTYCPGAGDINSTNTESTRNEYGRRTPPSLPRRAADPVTNSSILLGGHAPPAGTGVLSVLEQHGTSPSRDLGICPGPARKLGTFGTLEVFGLLGSVPARLLALGTYQQSGCQAQHDTEGQPPVSRLYHGHFSSIFPTEKQPQGLISYRAQYCNLHKAAKHHSSPPTFFSSSLYYVHRLLSTYIICHHNHCILGHGTERASGVVYSV